MSWIPLYCEKNTMCRFYLLLVCLVFFSVCQLCCASSIFRFIEYSLGFSQSKTSLIPVLCELSDFRDRQCRTVLKTKDHPHVSMLSTFIPSLTELVTENSEFLNDLSEKEQEALICLYLKKFFDGVVVYGDAFLAVMTILCRSENFAHVNFALDKGILNQSDVLTFFLKHQTYFMIAVKAGLLNHVDVATSIICGKSVLHVLAETGKVALFREIISRFSGLMYDLVKEDHFTDIENNSIIHSAVLSDNPEMIFEVVKDFSCLCGHVNNFKLTPLKLSFVNGNSFKSTEALLEHGCISHLDRLTEGLLFREKRRSEYLIWKMQISLQKMRKWAPCRVSEFSVQFEQIKLVVDSTQSDIIKEAYFMVLINSYRLLNSRLIQCIQEANVSSPFSNSSPSPYSRSFSFSQSPGTSRDRSQSPVYNWSTISSERFEPNDDEIFPLHRILNDLKFQKADWVKRIVLSNLTKLNSKSIDFSRTNLIQFIQILIDNGDMDVFVHFVVREIGVDLCIRIIFSEFDDLQGLIPFLKAISFDVSTPLIDGLYPIHLAVIYKRVDLVKFLVKEFNARLDDLTCYDQKNVLHFGLSSNSTREMTDFLLVESPQFLLIRDIFNTSPLASFLLNNDKFELVTLFFSIQHGSKTELSGEIASLFYEIFQIWPFKSEADQYYLKTFISSFEKCGHDYNARLLLSFISKKILKHFINEMGKLNRSFVTTINSSKSHLYPI